MSQSLKKNLILLFLLALSFAFILTACGGLGKEKDTAPPVPLNAIQNCNGAQVELAHPLSPQDQGTALQFFARHINPIILGRKVPVDPDNPEFAETQEACINCHRAGNFTTGIGFKDTTTLYDPYDEATQFNYNQFLCTANINYQNPAGSRILLKLIGKDQKSSMGPLGSIPGLHHMDNNFVVDRPGGPIFSKFKEWAVLEAELRTPGVQKAVGSRAIYLGRPSQLCWLETSLNNFDGGNHLPSDGNPSPKIFCAPMDHTREIDEEKITDVTEMLGLASGYRIRGLVPNKGRSTGDDEDDDEEDYKLFIGLRESGNSNYNVAVINFEFEEEDIEGTGFLGMGEESRKINNIIGTSWEYVVNEEFRTGCETYVQDYDHPEQPTTSRCSHAIPTTYYDGRVFFESNQQLFEHDRVNPLYPDPNDLNEENPAISLTKVSSGADTYHGGSTQKHSYSVGEDGIPKIFFQSSWHFHEHMAIGDNGKFNIIGWDNKKTGRRWTSKGQADWKKGGIMDAEAPIQGRSINLASLAEDDLTSKILPLSTGIVVLGIRAGGLQTGTIQALYHERGANFHLPGGELPPDKASGVQNPLENFTAFDELCDATDEDSEEIFEMDGLQGMPTRDDSGAGFFLAFTDVFVNTCDLLNDETGALLNSIRGEDGIGISWMDLNGNKKDIYKPPFDRQGYPNGTYVSDIAWIGPSQEAVKFTVDEEDEAAQEVEDKETATIYIPNAALYLMMRDVKAQNKQDFIDRFMAPDGSFRLDSIGVMMHYDNPPSHRDANIVSECRMCGSHPAKGGTEFYTGGREICRVPVREDFSWAATIDSRIPYTLIFYTTIETENGPIEIPFRQDGLRASTYGVNEFQAPVTVQHYKDECMACHGVTGENFISIKDMVLSHSGVDHDTNDTIAFQEGSVDCTTPSGPYMDYVHDVRPSLEAKGCLDCHGDVTTIQTDFNGIDVTFDDINPPGGLTFERLWVETTDPTVSSRYTFPYGHGDDGCGPHELQIGEDEITGEPECISCDEVEGGCTPHGLASPFEPGYALLQKRATAEAVAGRSIYVGSFGSRGPPDRSESIRGQCGTFLMTVYGDVATDGDCSGILGWDGQPWVHPNDLYPNMTHPVSGLPYDHRGQFTREEAQKFMDMVTTGMDYNREVSELSWGLAPIP